MCSPDIPDTSGATLASVATQERIADRNFAMQDQAFNYFKDRQVGLDATAEEVTRRQLAMGEETTAQGRDIYNYQKDVFRPVEQSLVSEAMRDSTPEYYEQYAQQAMTQQAGANANAQGQMERNLASMGVNPNSGAYASAQRGLQINNAASMGAVANDARDRAEALGWAKRAEVAGLGKGLVGAGNASYGLATGANNSAFNTTNQATQTAAGTLGTGLQYGQQGLTAANNATNAYTDIYRSQTQAAANSGGGVGSAIGSGVGMWASSGFAMKGFGA